MVDWWEDSASSRNKTRYRAPRRLRECLGRAIAMGDFENADPEMRELLDPCVCR